MLEKLARIPWLRILACLLTGTLLGTLGTCSPSRSLMEQVQELGTLRVASTNSPTTYYVGPTGPTGFEYDLAAGLAQQLGVQLEVTIAASAAEALDMVRRGRVHFAAAGIAVTPERGQQYRFSRPFHSVVPQLVYRMGEKKPQDPSELEGRLMVGLRTAALEHLKDLQRRYPALKWTETDEFETEELLLKVSEGEIDYTVADSDVLDINQRYYPKLLAAFPIADPQEVAWAFKPGRDNSLYAIADEYLTSYSGKELSRLRDRYFGHVDQVGYVGAVALATYFESRLPSLRPMFEKAAADVGLDWRFLAAIGYQESYWDANAVSYTGVRGIMQLTVDTAKFLQVQNRDDPAQSISGGARYIRRIIDLLPDVPDPDRTWLALAAYNLGVGHLRDVQALTAQRGGDPKRWVDIRANLPLLTQERWYRKLTYGYARGHEALTYVGNVRTYFDMLVFMTGGTPQPPDPSKQTQEEHKAVEENPLNIRSPIL
jgi:membrane-bound lytic murein transglycosylase F